LDLTLRFLCRQWPQAMGFSSLSASPPVASLSVICNRAISDALYRDSMVSGGLVDGGDPTAKHLLDPASEVSLSDGALTTFASHNFEPCSTSIVTHLFILGSWRRLLQRIRNGSVLTWGNGFPAVTSQHFRDSLLFNPRIPRRTTETKTICLGITASPRTWIDARYRRARRCSVCW